MEKKYYLIGLAILLGMNILVWTAVYDLNNGETKATVNLSRYLRGIRF